MDNMKRLRMFWMISILFAACDLVIVAGCQDHMDDYRRPAIYYIPEGYVGWVRVNYNIIGTPELPRDGVSQIFKIPLSGLLQTSSELKQGAASAEYFYYSGDFVRPMPEKDKRGGLISWAVKNADGSHTDKQFIYFFVGSRKEYDKHKNEIEGLKVDDFWYVVRSEEDLPKVGSLNKISKKAALNR
ncbi:MAG TPA: hypothetical protein VIQ24_21940 [Pyrinomonadaceae bacterium]